MTENNIWHSKEEKPERRCWIIREYTMSNGQFGTIDRMGIEFYDTKDIGDNTIRWAYYNDFLSLERENQRLKDFIANEVKPVVGFYSNIAHYYDTSDYEYGLDAEMESDKGKKSRELQQKIDEVLK